MAPTAENNTGPARKRAPGRPFPKGVSGNPGGRPKGLANEIREHTKDGEELVTFMLRVFRAELPEAKLRDRLDAATWLSDRAFGKPVQAMEHSGTDGEPLIPIALLQRVVADAERSGSGESST